MSLEEGHSENKINYKCISRSSKVKQGHSG